MHSNKTVASLTQWLLVALMKFENTTCILMIERYSLTNTLLAKLVSKISITTLQCQLEILFSEHIYKYIIIYRNLRSFIKNHLSTTFCP